jgi:hypothetical protein
MDQGRGKLFTFKPREMEETQSIENIMFKDMTTLNT